VEPVRHTQRATRPRACTAASHPGPSCGSCTVALSWRGVPLPVARADCRGLVGRPGPSLEGIARRRSWGSTVCPSQVCSRRPGGFHVSVEPGPRAVRAASSAPIDFRRGDRSFVRAGPQGSVRQTVRPGTRMRRLPGFNSRLRSESATPCAGTVADRSCLGLFLSQGWRARFTVHRRVVSTPPAITSLRG